MSLLGKPIHARSVSGKRRDKRYRRIQNLIYNFLERPRGCRAFFYHIIVFLVVFMCLVLSVFATIEEYEDVAGEILFYMEIIVVYWFTVEFILRLWSSGCRSRYQGCWGRLKFVRRPFCVIDIITIVASSVVILLGSGGQVFAASALRGLRFFQILRMVRMDRRGGSWKLLGSVVYAHRQELFTTLYIGFLGLVFASFLVYLAEKDANPRQFSNYADALWWGVITLCTVGYGDAVPVTWQGKMIASFCALLGISFFALPAGILGSGFALKVQQQQRQKHMIRRRQPAATLIQCLWRCYAADHNSTSIATWKIHQVPLPSPPGFKHNASFVTRLPTIRRHKQLSPHSPSLYGRGRHSNAVMADDGSRLNASTSEDSVNRGGVSESGKKNSDDEEEEPRLLQLTDQHKNAIRAIRKIQYFVSRRKFKGAFKPFDIKDVIEQYSLGHADLSCRVRAIHSRLDVILGKPGSKAKDVYESDLTLASRIVKTERQVDDLEMKLDQFIEMYLEDRKRLSALPFPEPKPPPPTPQLAESPSITPTSSMKKPRSILASSGNGDKTASEPVSPESYAGGDHGLLQGQNFIHTAPAELANRNPCFQFKNLPPALRQINPRLRGMVRGHSDLGMRLRKKVTLSSVPTDPSGNLDGMSRAGSDNMFQSNANNRLSASSLNSPSSMTPPPAIRLPPFSHINGDGDDDIERGQSCLIDFAGLGACGQPSVKQAHVRTVIMEENETSVAGNSSDAESQDSSLSVSTPLLTVPGLPVLLAPAVAAVAATAANPGISGSSSPPVSAQSGPAGSTRIKKSLLRVPDTAL